jgi:hypothetical protein
VISTHITKLLHPAKVKTHPENTIVWDGNAFGTLPCPSSRRSAQQRGCGKIKTVLGGSAPIRKSQSGWVAKFRMARKNKAAGAADAAAWVRSAEMILEFVPGARYAATRWLITGEVAILRQ